MVNPAHPTEPESIHPNHLATPQIQPPPTAESSSPTFFLQSTFPFWLPHPWTLAPTQHIPLQHARGCGWAKILEVGPDLLALSTCSPRPAGLSSPISGMRILLSPMQNTCFIDDGPVKSIETPAWSCPGQPAHPLQSWRTSDFYLRFAHCARAAQARGAVGGFPCHAVEEARSPRRHNNRRQKVIV